jgi:hypothetical protein
VLELPKELVLPDPAAPLPTAATEDEQLYSVPEPRAALTQVLERPGELSLPDLDAPAPGAAEEDKLPDTQEAPEDGPHVGTHSGEGPVRNGTMPDVTDDLASSEPATSGVGAQPKRQRQPRSKRKRSS